MFISHYLYVARLPLPTDQELNARQENIMKWHKSILISSFHNFDFTGSKHV